jgi:hypothetical protein
MASFLFDEGAKGLTSNGTIDWASDTIKARLVDASVTPSRTATAMTGLTALGTDQTLGSKTKTKDTTNHRIVFDGADLTFPAVAAGSTGRYLVFYKFVTNDAGSTPIFAADMTSVITNGLDILMQLNASGIFYLQA